MLIAHCWRQALEDSSSPAHHELNNELTSLFELVQRCFHEGTNDVLWVPRTIADEEGFDRSQF